MRKGRKIAPSIAISWSTASIAILRSTAPIAIARSVNRNLAKRQLRSREVSIAISRSVGRNLAKRRADRSPSSNPVVSLCSFFSQFDRIWWFFFLGFVCVSVLRNEWYYIFVWQSRKCDQIWWFFFFWVLFVFLYWGMNDIIYSFGNQENVRKCE